MANFDGKELNKTREKKFQHYKARYIQTNDSKECSHSQAKFDSHRCGLSTSADQSHSINQHVSENLNIQLTTKQKVGRRSKLKVETRIKLNEKLSRIIENFDHFDDEKLKKMGNTKLQQLVKKYLNRRYSQVNHHQTALNTPKMPGLLNCRTTLKNHHPIEHSTIEIAVEKNCEDHSVVDDKNSDSAACNRKKKTQTN